MTCASYTGSSHLSVPLNMVLSQNTVSKIATQPSDSIPTVVPSEVEKSLAWCRHSLLIPIQHGKRRLRTWAYILLKKSKRGYSCIRSALGLSFLVTTGLQINRSICNGQDNQKWDITQDPETLTTTFASVYNQKCWDNNEAKLGQSLNQYGCVIGSANNKRFYLEFQGYVTNCSGAAGQKVRYDQLPDKKHSH